MEGSQGELIVYHSSWRLCVSVCVHTLKHECLCNQRADRNQILSEASFGWGKGCIRFLVRSDQNSGFHGNRGTYNGRNVVNTPAPSFFIGFSSFLQVTRTCIKAWMSLNFGTILPQTTGLAALEHLKNQCIML